MDTDMEVPRRRRRPGGRKPSQLARQLRSNGLECVLIERPRAIALINAHLPVLPVLKSMNGPHNQVDAASGSDSKTATSAVDA